MIETYESTFAIRLALALLAFAALLVFDLLRHGLASPRLREYGFLLLTTFMAVGYGIVHDHVTATISPEYFLLGKGLANDPRPFRWAVTVLAFRATYGVGLLGGALLLIANNPSTRTPQVPYRSLIRLCCLPLCLALLCAVVGGLLIASGMVGSLAAAAAEIAGENRATRFLITWGMHGGSYAGGALGTVIAIGLVMRRRRQFRSTQK